MERYQGFINAFEAFKAVNPQRANEMILNNLSYAVYNGAETLIKVLLEHGADPNGKRNGQSMLSYAFDCSAGIEIYKLLLQHGANPDLPGKNDDRLLITVITHNDIEVFNLLLQYGVNVNVKTVHNMTPLINSCFNPINFEITKKVLEKTTDINVKCQYDGNDDASFFSAFKIFCSELKTKSVDVESIMEIMMMFTIRNDFQEDDRLAGIKIFSEKLAKSKTINQKNIYAKLIGYLRTYKKAAKILEQFVVEVVYRPESYYVNNSLKTEFEKLCFITKEG